MDKIVYALNLIVDLIDTNASIDEGLISDYLFFTGFDDYEVRQVMAFLDMGCASDQKYFRIFSKTEKNKFTPEAVNYLNKLMVSGVLDFSTVEDIMEKALTSHVLKVDVDTIKELTFFHLLERKSGIGGGIGRPDEYIQ